MALSEATVRASHAGAFNTATSESYEGHPPSERVQRDLAIVAASLTREDMRLLTVIGQGITQREAARVLDRSADGVRTQLCRLRRRMNHIMPRVIDPIYAWGDD